jgi:hypothetical protein
VPSKLLAPIHLLTLINRYQLLPQRLVSRGWASVGIIRLFFQQEDGGEGVWGWGFTLRRLAGPKSNVHKDRLYGHFATPVAAYAAMCIVAMREGGDRSGFALQSLTDVQTVSFAKDHLFII